MIARTLSCTPRQAHCSAFSMVLVCLSQEPYLFLDQRFLASWWESAWVPTRQLRRFPCAPWAGRENAGGRQEN